MLFTCKPFGERRWHPLKACSRLPDGPWSLPGQEVSQATKRLPCMWSWGGLGLGVEGRTRDILRWWWWWWWCGAKCFGRYVASWSIRTVFLFCLGEGPKSERDLFVKKTTIVSRYLLDSILPLFDTSGCGSECSAQSGCSLNGNTNIWRFIWLELKILDPKKLSCKLSLV